jgi:RNA polymerase sigma-70 factor (ECF subfamily)
VEKQSQCTVTDIEAVVRKYAGMVYKLAVAQVHTISDADDIFQEVFLRYFRKAPRFETEEHQKAWLIRVTVNCSKKYWSSAWNRKVIPLDDELAAPDREDSGLQDALGRLSDKYRAVIHLFYYEGYPISDISKILKVKQSTVRTQLTRARAQLGEFLKGEC